MRYHVRLDPSPDAPTHAVDVTTLPNGALSVVLNGRPVATDVMQLRDQLSIRIDGKVVDLTLEGLPPDVGAIASGQRSYVRVESERMRAASQAKRGGAAATKVLKSPMPGRVIKVLAKAGDAVEVGAPLLVVEAMKMENEVRAKAVGVIGTVHVSLGDTVEANAKLITFA